MSQEAYKPTDEEIKDAEEMMGVEQKFASKIREQNVLRLNLYSRMNISYREPVLSGPEEVADYEQLMEEVLDPESKLEVAIRGDLITTIVSSIFNPDTTLDEVDSEKKDSFMRRAYDDYRSFFDAGIYDAVSNAFFNPNNRHGDPSEGYVFNHVVEYKGMDIKGPFLLALKTKGPKASFANTGSEFDALNYAEYLLKERLIDQDDFEEIRMGYEFERQIHALKLYTHFANQQEN